MHKGGSQHACYCPADQHRPANGATTPRSPGPDPATAIQPAQRGTGPLYHIPCSKLLVDMFWQSPVHGGSALKSSTSVRLSVKVQSSGQQIARSPSTSFLPAWLCMSELNSNRQALPKTNLSALHQGIAPTW